MPTQPAQKNIQYFEAWGQYFVKIKIRVGAYAERTESNWEWELRELRCFSCDLCRLVSK